MKKLTITDQKYLSVIVSHHSFINSSMKWAISAHISHLCF